MRKYSIRKWFSKELFTPTVPVTDFSGLDDLLDNFRTVSIIEKNIAMSANQLGDDRRVFVYGKYPSLDYFVNPKILRSFGKRKLYFERCASFPGLRFPRLRYEFVDLNYQNEMENNFGEVFEGRKAAVIQHEVAHLDGKHPFSWLIKVLQKS